MLPDPRRHHPLHAMIRAATSREPGDQLRRDLHRVEVPPAAFFRVIRKAARLATFRAGNAEPTWAKFSNRTFCPA